MTEPLGACDCCDERSLRPRRFRSFSCVRDENPLVSKLAACMPTWPIKALLGILVFGRSVVEFTNISEISRFLFAVVAYKQTQLSLS